MSDHTRSTDVEVSREAKFFSKNLAWTVSAVFMSLIGIGLAIVLVPSGNEPSNPPVASPSPPLSSPPTPVAPTAAATGWDDLGCNGTRGSESVPNLPPKANWRPLGTYSVPTSSKLGPAVDGEAPRCFQHTPAGALFAAINFPFAIGSATSTAYSDVVTTLMTPGSQRDELVAAGQVTQGSAPAFQVAGYQIDACEPHRCNVRVIMSSAGQLLEMPSSLVWKDGDWKVDGATLTGFPGPVATMPPGFTTFGPGQ